MSVTPDSTARSVVVTGAAGALGRATALRLADDGFAVGVLGHAGEDLELTADLIRSSGASAVTLEVDLRDTEAIEAAILRTEADLGPLHALVNNAAIYPSTPFLDIALSEYEDVLNVNQRAYFFGAQVAARLMMPRQAGAIVNIGSITWTGGWANLASYVSTKGAAISLTRALARELGPMGIRVNAVSPGAFPTKAERIQGNAAEYSAFVIERQAIKRRGASEEVASVVSFLIGPDSSFITGQTINVDGGWVMV